MEKKKEEDKAQGKAEPNKAEVSLEPSCNPYEAMGPIDATSVYSNCEYKGKKAIKLSLSKGTIKILVIVVCVVMLVSVLALCFGLGVSGVSWKPRLPRCRVEQVSRILDRTDENTVRGDSGPLQMDVEVSITS